MSDKPRKTILSFFKKVDDGQTQVISSSSTVHLNERAQKYPRVEPEPKVADINSLKRDPGLREQINSYPVNERDDIRRKYINMRAYQPKLEIYPRTIDAHPEKYSWFRHCRDRRSRTGDSRGFAFVRYKYADEAQKAVERLDGRTVDGREIMVQFAKYGPDAERIHKGRIIEETDKPKGSSRSRSPRPRYRDEYRSRDGDRDRYRARERDSRRRSRSRSRDRYDRDRYRGREREHRRRSRSRSASPAHPKDRRRGRADDAERSRSRSNESASPVKRSPIPQQSPSPVNASPHGESPNGHARNERSPTPKSVSPRGRSDASRSPSVHSDADE